MHVNVGEQLKLYPCVFPEGISAQTLARVVVGRILAVLLEAGTTEVLNDVRQQQNVCPKVQIVVVNKGGGAKGLPDFLSMGIVFMGNAWRLSLL